MMRTITLYGRLKKEFGPKHRFDVATAAEALRALNCAFPGRFVAALRTGSYKLVRGDRRNGMHLDIDLVNGLKLGLADLHIMPVAAGAANSKGLAKTILGAVLIGSAIFFAPAGGGLIAGMGALSPIGISWGTIAAVGLGLALSGVSTLLAGDPAKKADASKNDSSFTINGPTNSARQGDAVALIYGEVITGSVNVSFDADIENIGAYQGVTNSLGATVQALLGFDGPTVLGGS